MDLCFQDGQIPCRWVPDMGYGYGYPLFNYYPVMPSYLGELVYKIVLLVAPVVALVWSVKIVFALSLLISGITMFLLAKQFWGNLGGFVSSLFYMYAPYHAVDIYVRGAMAEAWSLSWTPAVFLMIYLTIQKASLKNITLLAIFIALFLTSHNPMALLFTPIMAIWAVIFLVISKNYRSAYKLAIAGVWGLGLAAFFTLPVVLEGKYVHLETLFIGYFNYLAHFVGLNQLFLSTFWGFGGSIWGVEDGMSFQIGWLHWGGILITLILSFLLWKKDKQKSIILIFLFLVFLGATFLIHPRSNPIWEKVTILQTIQFPWRILAVIIFASSFAIGSLLSVEISKRLKAVLLTCLIIGAAILYQPYFQIEKIISLTDKEKLSGALWDLQRTAGIFDYLPKTAKFPPASAAPEIVEVASGSATITDFKRGTDSLKFKVDSSSGAILRLPIIDFPQWRVFVDNIQVQFSNQNELGQPTFEVSAGRHEVMAKLFNTPLRTAANLISLVSFIALIVVITKIYLRKK